MEDTWTKRDLPVLDAIVRLLEDKDDWPSRSDVAEVTGFDEGTVGRAVEALEGTYVRSHPERRWLIGEVTAEARRTVGQWQTAESFIDRLAEAFNKAADREPDKRKRNHFREIASMLTGSFKEFAVSVAAEVVARKIP